MCASIMDALRGSSWSDAVEVDMSDVVEVGMSDVLDVDSFDFEAVSNLMMTIMNLAVGSAFAIFARSQAID
jgi:hypothetical protein